MFLVLGSLLAACEVADVGYVVVTWRFNGHAMEGDNNPCAAIGADRIVIRLDGPGTWNEVVACDNDDPNYPLLWLGFAADLPVDAYGRLLRDVKKGHYDVRVFFIDAEGQELDEPTPWTGSLTVDRDETTRVDLDFDVESGSITARWRVGGAIPNQDGCDAADASSIHLVVSEPGGTTVTEATVGCANTSGWILAGLDPGDYDLSGQLLDAQGSPITEMVSSTGNTVVVADTTSVVLEFPWDLFFDPPQGNLRFQVTYDDEDTVCSEVTGLAQGPLRTRMQLAAGGTPVTGAVAYPNPDGQTDCAGLTGALTLDGAQLSPCADDALIVCDLPAGTYQLSVSALDASDLICYAATVDLDVDPAPPEEPQPAVVASSDATQCWQ